MTTSIALLRGINVGGRNRVAMADLKALLKGLGLKEIQTYIQSGNIVFKSGKPTSDLEKTISEAFQKRFGFSSPVVVITLVEWQDIVAKNPFLSDPNMDKDFLHVTFFSGTPSEEGIEKIMQIPAGDDQIKIIGNAAYLYCSNGYHKTKLTNNTLENKLGVTATTRNWRTVKKLQEMAGE